MTNKPFRYAAALLMAAALTIPATSFSEEPAPVEEGIESQGDEAGPAPSVPLPAGPGRIGEMPVISPSRPAFPPPSSRYPAGPALSQDAPGATQPDAGPMRFQRPQRPGGGTVVLNFSEANLKDILRTIAEITGENFIIAPGVTARISVQTTKPVERKAVLDIFSSVLEVNGLAAVRTGDYYKIVPAPAARQRAADVYTGRDPGSIPAGDRVINLVVPVDYVPAGDLAQIIKPMLSPTGAIANFPKTNTLLVTDIASGIKGALEVINALDIDAFERMKMAFVNVEKVNVKTLYKELSEVFTALGLGKDTPQFAVIPIERLNSLAVFSSNGDLLESAKEWIARLDRSSTSEDSSVHIYYVQNDKASNIKNLLDQLYGGKKTAAAAQAGGPGPQTYQAQPQQAAAAARQEGRAEAGSEDIKIFIYEPSNALIIQSSQADYINMLGAIKELDRIPKQVLIDALIAEVRLDEGTKYGIQWSVLTGNFDIQQNTGIFSTSINDPRGRVSTPIGLSAPAGLSVFATDASRFFAALQALASTGRVDVLSNPHIVVKNYEKASINVGTDEPVATQSTQSAVTGTAGIIQTIEYRKTGVILTVTPHITEGGMVAMTIRQEVSDKSTDRTVGNATYPSFSKREAETSVVAKDRETLVIGGLIQDRNDESTSGIPILSKIPLLGNLFRFTTRNNGKTELIILLTPKVVGDGGQAAAVMDEFKARLGELRELMRKEGYDFRK